MNQNIFIMIYNDLMIRKKRRRRGQRTYLKVAFRGRKQRRARSFPSDETLSSQKYLNLTLLYLSTTPISVDLEIRVCVQILRRSSLTCINNILVRTFPSQRTFQLVLSLHIPQNLAYCYQGNNNWCWVQKQMQQNQATKNILGMDSCLFSINRQLQIIIILL